MTSIISPRRRVAVSVGGLLVRAAALALLLAGLLVWSRWVGRAVAQPGDWVELDQALYRAANGVSSRPLMALWTATLNEPAPGYLALIAAILGYCGWRRRALLPAAALAIAIALAVGLLATVQTHAAGNRERPFLHVPEAKTPITSCRSGFLLVALRDGDGPTASCEPGKGQVVGVDWREIWVQFRTFPSGHMRETVSLSLLLVAFWPGSWPYALAYNVLMAFSRVHIGAHYPSDVLAGAAVGLWAGGLTLLALDLLRRLLSYVHRLPAARAASDWVFATRVAGRPHLDPLPARLTRIALYAAGLNLALYGLGQAVSNPDVGHLHTVLQSADAVAFSVAATQFDPALASILHRALGPAGALYGMLAGAAVLAGALRGRRAAAATFLALAAALALSLELRWLGLQFFDRPPPLHEDPEFHLPPEWRAAWATVASFPNMHALLAAALAGILAGTWRRAAIAAQLLGLTAGLLPVYLGTAWVTDVLGSYLLGNLSAALAHRAVTQFVPLEPRSRD